MDLLPFSITPNRLQSDVIQNIRVTFPNFPLFNNSSTGIQDSIGIHLQERQELRLVLRVDGPVPRLRVLSLETIDEVNRLLDRNVTTGGNGDLSIAIDGTKRRSSSSSPSTWLGRPAQAHSWACRLGLINSRRSCCRWGGIPSRYKPTRWVTTFGEPCPARYRRASLSTASRWDSQPLPGNPCESQSHPPYFLTHPGPSHLIWHCLVVEAKEAVFGFAEATLAGQLIPGFLGELAGRLNARDR